jgi:hypothetical protein
MNEFCCILASNASLSVCEDNTLTHFTNIFSNEVNLGQGWMVGLQALSFDNSYSNIPYSVIKTKTPHFILYQTSPSVAKVKPILYLDLENKFYAGPLAVSRTFNRQVPHEYSNYITSTIRNKKLVFIVRGTILYILEELCAWLSLITRGKARAYINGQTYVEIDATKQDIPILSEITATYGQTPNFVRVVIDEVKQSLSGGGVNRDLAIVPFTAPKGQNPLFYYEVGRKEYFPLENNCLNRLTVRLLDERGDELNLTSGQPTFVKLKFKKMDVNSSFVLRINSGNSKNIFPGNHSGHFRTQLPHTVNLSGGLWEVALLSVHFPAKVALKTYLKRADFWLSVLIPPADILSVGNSITLTFANDNITSGDSLKNAINTKIEQWVGPNVLTVVLSPDGLIKFRATVKMDITLSPLLALIIADLQPKHGQMNYQIKLIEVPGEFSASLPVDFSRCLPHNLLLYTDFIKPIIVGERYSRVLKLIPMLESDRKNVESYKSYESQNLDFCLISNNNIQTMECELRDASGEIIFFEEEDLPSYVHLLFRRK